MRTANGLAAMSIKIPITIDAAAKKHTAPPITFPHRSCLCSPIYCPNRTVTPMDSPAVTNTTKLIILLPVDTAERPAVVPNQPTTSKSTAPYMACKIRAQRMGIINLANLAGILPVVKSLICSLIFLFSQLFYSTTLLPIRSWYQKRKF